MGNEKYYEISLFERTGPLLGASHTLYIKVSGTKEGIRLYEKFGSRTIPLSDAISISHNMREITKETYESMKEQLESKVCSEIAH